MNDKDHPVSDPDPPRRLAHAVPPPEVPPDFVELVAFRSASIEHRLGYFGKQPCIIFAYCPGGGEVLWKDGHTAGFGSGGWSIWHESIVPAAAHLGAVLGDGQSVGSHVLWIDRHRRIIYAATRASAEAFYAQVYGLTPPKRQCLCARVDCPGC